MQLSSIIKLVFPVIFNLIFFLFVATESTSAQWSSWFFINLAYAAFIYSLRDQVKDRLSVLSFSLYAIGLFYFFAALLVGVAFMMIFKTAMAASCIVQLILLGLFVVTFLGSKLANTSTEQSIAEQRQQGLFIQGMLATVNSCLDLAKTHTPDGVSALRQLAEAIEISPLQSNATVGQLEQELQATLHHLQQAVAASDTQNVTSLAQQALLQIKQRNALLENSGV